MTEFYAGQIAYQDLIEPKTLKVAGSADIARGDFCTMHTNGYLVPATTEAGKPTDFKAGLFVALQKVNNTGANGDETCQVACVRSRVIVKAAANVTLGMPVQTVLDSKTHVKPAATNAPANSVVGTVYEFPGEPDKVITALNDLVVIDLGIGV